MSSIRVAMLGGYPLDPTRIHGGVQGATTYLINGLSRIDGLELHALTVRPSGSAGQNYMDQRGVHVHLLPPPPRFERLRRYRVYQSAVMQELRKIQPDVLHAQEASADAYVSLRSGYPTVVTAHGIRAEDAKFSRSWARRLRFMIDARVTERYVMRQAGHLIAISQYVTRYFAPLLRKDICLYFIPNAVDDSFFRLEVSSKKPVVLYVGRVTPLKRVLDLVQSFVEVARQIPEAELRIAGEWSSEPAYTASVCELIRSSRLASRIHLLGELRQPELLSQYQHCSLAVLPSAQENAPMTLAQAMAAGKPVVSTRVGGIPDMIGANGERGMLVDVGDVAAMSAAIVDLLNNPDLRAQMGNAGRAFAQEYYQMDRVAQRTCDVYRQVAAAAGNSDG